MKRASADGAPMAILPVQNSLGEGILWDARQGLLMWTDIHGRRLYRHDWARGHTAPSDMPGRVGSFGLVAGGAQLIVAFEAGIALYDLRDQSVSWLLRPPDLGPFERFNDGRVDRQGRFWCGTLIENAQAAATGALYCVGCGAGARRHLGGIRTANGLCMSPDGRHLYFTDSATRVIQVFELKEPQGELGRPRVFAEVAAGEPDGATVDAEGCLWSAHWGAGRVVRYTPKGRIDRIVHVPASQPSCVCFAGPDLDVMCVTTARHGLTEAQLREEPEAGNVLLYRVGVRGLAEEEYRP